MVVLASGQSWPAKYTPSTTVSIEIATARMIQMLDQYSANQTVEEIRGAPLQFLAEHYTLKDVQGILRFVGRVSIPLNPAYASDLTKSLAEHVQPIANPGTVII